MIYNGALKPRTSVPCGCTKSDRRTHGLGRDSFHSFLRFWIPGDFGGFFGEVDAVFGEEEAGRVGGIKTSDEMDDDSDQKQFQRNRVMRNRDATQPNGDKLEYDS